MMSSENLREYLQICAIPHSRMISRNMAHFGSITRYLGIDGCGSRLVTIGDPMPFLGSLEFHTCMVPMSETEQILDQVCLVRHYSFSHDVLHAFLWILEKIERFCVHTKWIPDEFHKPFQTRQTLAWRHLKARTKWRTSTIFDRDVELGKETYNQWLLGLQRRLLLVLAFTLLSDLDFDTGLSTYNRQQTVNNSLLGALSMTTLDQICLRK